MNLKRLALRFVITLAFMAVFMYYVAKTGFWESFFIGFGTAFIMYVVDPVLDYRKEKRAQAKTSHPQDEP